MSKPTMLFIDERVYALFDTRPRAVKCTAQLVATQNTLQQLRHTIKAARAQQNKLKKHIAKLKAPAQILEHEQLIADLRHQLVLAKESHLAISERLKSERSIVIQYQVDKLLFLRNLKGLDDFKRVSLELEELKKEQVIAKILFDSATEERTGVFSRIIRSGANVHYPEKNTEYGKKYREAKARSTAAENHFYSVQEGVKRKERELQQMKSVQELQRQNQDILKKYSDFCRYQRVDNYLFGNLIRQEEEILQQMYKGIYQSGTSLKEKSIKLCSLEVTIKEHSSMIQQRNDALSLLREQAAYQDGSISETDLNVLSSELTRIEQDINTLRDSIEENTKVKTDKKADLSSLNHTLNRYCIPEAATQAYIQTAHPILIYMLEREEKGEFLHCYGPIFGMSKTDKLKACRYLLRNIDENGILVIAENSQEFQSIRGAFAKYSMLGDLFNSLPRHSPENNERVQEDSEHIRLLKK